MTGRRMAAGLVAALGASGVLLHFVDLLQAGQSAVEAAWTMLRFFTILTNLLAFALFARIVADRRAFDRPQWEAAITLALLLVGLVYAVLLHGLVELTPMGAIANGLVHQATPVTAALFWLFFTRKGALTYRSPWLWAFYPLLYLGYALARGAFDGRYPYPFIDVANLGYAAAIGNAALVAVAFIAVGYGLVAIDRGLSRRR